MKWISILLLLFCGCRTTMSFLVNPNTCISVSIDDKENIQVSIDHFNK